MVVDAAGLTPSLARFAARVVCMALAVLLVALPAIAAPVRVGPATLAVEGADTVLHLPLDRPVPVRSFTLDAPHRVVLDLPEASFAPEAPAPAGLVAGLRWGLAAPGRSRLVVALSGPAAVRVESGAQSLVLRLSPVSPEAFSSEAGWPDGARAAMPVPAPPVVVLDPGHGGRDPGAVVAGVREKEVTLQVAHMLAAALRDRGLAVVLTRTDDRFVPLPERVEIARAAGAALLLSLHADTVRAGEASGASVYLLGREATDAEAAGLAERENAVDRYALTEAAGEGRDVAQLLYDLVTRETAERSSRLGPVLVDALAESVPVLAGRPLRRAGFRVLKAPDLPSALVELGFLSNAADRARLVDPVWRQAAVAALAEGVMRWFGKTKPLACDRQPCHRPD